MSKDFRLESKAIERKKPITDWREVHDCYRLAGLPPLLVVCKIFLVNTIVSKIPDLVELKEDWGWGQAAIAFFLENFVAEVAGII